MQKFRLVAVGDSTKIMSVKVVAVEPEQSDVSRLEHLRNEVEPKLENVIFLVKIYMSGIPISGTGMSLFIGDEKIPKYWPFNGGVYFIIYEPEFFVKHKHSFIGFSLDGDITVKKSVSQIPEPQYAPAAKTFSLLAMNAASHSTLPTKRAALSD
jgi:hypothetical protein